MGGNTAQPLAQPAPQPAAQPTNDSVVPPESEDLDFGNAAPQQPQPTGAPNPLDKPPFDAGVEADEKSDPKKFIEQLTGKLGQSLRTFTQTQGQPDFELEKFAINSLLSATHTSEMEDSDKQDIIKKIDSSSDEDDEAQRDPQSQNQEPTPEPPQEPAADPNAGGDKMFESDLFLANPKKNNMFQEGSNDILDEMKPCWKGHKQIGMKEKGGKEVPNCVPVDENLKEQKKNSIFAGMIKTKLIETFMDDVTEDFIEPATKPTTKPKEKPIVKPSRRDSPFLPDVTPSVQPKPKAKL